MVGEGGGVGGEGLHITGKGARSSCSTEPGQAGRLLSSSAPAASAFNRQPLHSYEKFLEEGIYDTRRRLFLLCVQVNIAHY